MKKVFLLILDIIIFSSIKVDALECTDPLEFVATKDTVAHTLGVASYNLKKGSEFKMCHQAGADAIVILADGKQATWVDDYKLKEKFNIKNAHPLENTYVEVMDIQTEVYPDPTSLNKIGNIPGGTKLLGTFYYGTYVFENMDH